MYRLALKTPKMVKMSESVKSEATPYTPPEIHEAEKHRVYSFITLDNVQKEKTVQDIFKGDAFLEEHQKLGETLRSILTTVMVWSQGQKEHLLTVLFEIRRNKLMFFMVPKSVRYDRILGNKLSDLEGQLMTYGVGYIQTLQVRNESLSRFVNNHAMIIWTNEEVNANQGTAPQAV